MWRRRSNHPGNSQAKGPYILTLEREEVLAEGANLSGNKDRGGMKELIWKQKKHRYLNFIKKMEQSL